MCVIELTKHIMDRQKMEYEAAYKQLLSTELYQLLQDAETRLFLETNHYLNEAYDREMKLGKDGLYAYINSNI